MIPANDDASKSIEVIITACCDAIAEGLEERKVEKIDMEAAGEQQEAVADEPVKPKRTRKTVKKAEAVAEEEAPVAEEAPAVEEAPAAEEAPATEEAPAEDKE